MQEEERKLGDKDSHEVRRGIGKKEDW